MRPKRQKSFAVVSFSFVFLIGCLAATLPSSQIAQLLKTNTACRVRLQPAWTGVTEQTVRTGFFTNVQSAQLERLQRELRFDWFAFSDKPSHFNYGPRTISRSAGGESETAIHTYRAELPTDGAIQACTTISALTNLLGPSQGFHDGAPFSAGWSFFTCTPTNTIMTLSVFSIRQRVEGQIDSLEIRRGIVREGR